MRKRILFFIKCIAIYLLLLVIGYQFGLAVKCLFIHPMQYLYFCIGIITAFLLMRLFGGQRLSFAQTFTHELIHTLFAYLSFGKIYSFQVGENSGLMTSNRNDMAMILAPYYFPLYTILLLCIRPSIMVSYLPVFDILCGASFSFYIHMIKQQTGLWQTDIRSIDWRISYPFVILMVFLFSYLVISSIRYSLWYAIQVLVKNIFNMIVSALQLAF